MSKAGFVTIIGKPNVGKSTLMNTLIGQKIAITSYKPQTTRKQVRTIYTDENGQIVFIDTPGLQKGKDHLAKYMYEASLSTLKEVDLILVLVEPKLARRDKDSTSDDPADLVPKDEKEVIRLAEKAADKTPVVLVITKVDTVPRDALLPILSSYSALWKKDTGKELADLVPVSARKKQGIEDLKKTIFSYLPEGEPFYGEDEVTTETEREIAQDIIREKALRLLQEEVPHGIAVKINRMKYRTAKAGEEICDIDADVLCEREAHKGIIIGKGGEMLKKIGTAARTDIEEMIGTKVNLKLFVRVRRDWKDDPALLKSLGYNEKDLKQ